MSFLTKMTTSYVAKGNISIDDLNNAYQQKLASKYKVKVEKKGGNAVSRAVSGNTHDKLLIAKNRYHRTFVFANYDASANETYFGFDEATVDGALSIVIRQTGLLGLGIMRLCYGNGKEFYTDVVNVIKETYKPDERTINTGLSALWKKEKK